MSEGRWPTGSGCAVVARPMTSGGGRRLARAGGRGVCLLALCAATLLAGPPDAPRYDLTDEPLLASAISDKNVEMRGRYARQWTDESGTLVLMFSGGFRLDMGARRLSGSNAVVWLNPGQVGPDGRKYSELTVYLSESAEVREAGGTITTDNVLLVRDLKTYGQVIKYQDAHVDQPMEQSPLYQQALRDRAAIEGAEGETAEPSPAVARPAEARHPKAERPPRVIRYRLPMIEPAETPSGERVFVSLGGVYFSQDGGPDAPMLEIRADNAVVFPAEGAASSFLGSELEGRQESQPQKRADVEKLPAEQGQVEPAPEPAVPTTAVAASAPSSPARVGEPEAQKPGLLGLEAQVGPARVRGVYLEGDVVLSLGSRFVRANRLYYDFEHDRALILDAVMRADIPARGIPLYVRADEIRQLSAREVSAKRAVVTTSEFYTPSYHVGAERVVVRDITTRDTVGRATGPVTGSYALTNAELSVEGVPLLWWPYSEGSLEESETLLRRLSMGYSSDRGARVQSSWYLFNLAGVKPPPGYDATLRLDYFSERGPAVGVNADYEREDHYGLFRSYLINDQGKDELGPLRRAEEEPENEQRGRVLWRHRHFLPYDWEATLELAYVSDPYFLEEYEKSEWFEGKEQETAVYLKRARGNEAITLLANWRMLDFVTQTEHLPEGAYRRIGDTFLDPVVLYHESRIGGVRYLPDDRYFFDHRRFNNDGRTDVTARGDVREEAELPLKLGPVNLVPFGSVRGTYWDGQPMDDGALWRGLGVYGARGSTTFSRTFEEVQSELLDINRIRHIIKPDFAAWWAHSSARSAEITPFDYGIETIDAFYGGTFALRQTWQTKRGPASKPRTVDLLKFDLEVGAFGDTDGRRDASNGYANPLRPENSRTRNYLAGDLIYRLSDSTSFLYDFNFDLNDRSFDRHDVSIAVERSPRLAYVFGTRYAGDIHMSLVGGGWNYKLNEKHITSVRAWWDVDTGELGEVAVAYVRKLPRWYAGVNFEYSNIDDNFTVSLSLWPEGIPEWTLGSRRFTGLGTSTGIKP